MSATSIATELRRIQTAKADIKTAIEAKGVQVPSNALIDTYDTYIGQISGGGGGQAEEDLIDLIEGDIVTLNIPSGTTKIADWAFQMYTSLASVTIPDSVTSIGRNAFNGCSGLTSMTIPSGVTSIGNYAFQNCTSLASVTIGSGVTSIGIGAFDACPKLTSINIPSSVTSIGNQAFSSCSKLTSVTIPDSVTSIGNQAFSSCSKLTSVTSLSITPPTLGFNAFAYNASGRKIYVPAASVETYKAASGWSTYAADIEAIPSE